MEKNIESLKMAIASIEKCESEVYGLLGHAPILQVQSRHALQRLANSLRIASGANPESGDTADSEDKKPLTHILGIPIGGGKAVKKKPVDEAAAAPERVSKMEHLGKLALEDIKNGAESDVVLEKHGAKAVLAAGIMSGSVADGTDIEDVNVETVDSIRAVLEAEEERQRQVKEAEAAAAQKEEGDKGDKKQEPSGDTKNDTPIAERIAAKELELQEVETDRDMLAQDATPQQKAALTKKINTLTKELGDLKQEQSANQG